MVFRTWTTSIWEEKKPKEVNSTIDPAHAWKRISRMQLGGWGQSLPASLSWGNRVENAEKSLWGSTQERRDADRKTELWKLEKDSPRVFGWAPTSTWREKAAWDGERRTPSCRGVQRPGGFSLHQVMEATISNKTLLLISFPKICNASVTIRKHQTNLKGRAFYTAHSQYSSEGSKSWQISKDWGPVTGWGD